MPSLSQEPILGANLSGLMPDAGPNSAGGADNTTESLEPVGGRPPAQRFRPVDPAWALEQLTSTSKFVPVDPERALRMARIQESPGYGLVAGRSTIDLANDDEFSPTAVATQFPELLEDPEIVERMALAHAMKKARGVDWVKLGYNAVKGSPSAFAELVQSLVVDAPKNLIAANDPRKSETERKAAALKLQAGLELAVSENVLIAGMSKKRVKELYDIAIAANPALDTLGFSTETLKKIGAKVQGAERPAASQDPKTRFFEEVAEFENIKKITEGEGAITSKFVVPVTGALGMVGTAATALGRASAGEDVKPEEVIGAQIARDGKSPIEQLKEEGVVVDQDFMDEVDRLSNVVDPLNILPGVGGAFKIVTKTGKVLATVPGLAKAARVAKGISEAVSAKKAAGKLIQAAGATAEGVGKQASRVSPGISGGVAAGLVTGGLTVPQAAAAVVAAPVLKSVGGWAKRLGVDVASDAPKSMAAKAIAGGVDVATGTVKGGLDGFVATAPLLLLLDDQDMAEQVASYGIAGGVMGRGIAAGGQKVKTAAQTALLKAATNFYSAVERTPVVSQAYGKDVGLDAKHTANEAKLKQRDSKLGNVTNFLRESLRPQGVELYLIDGEDMRTRAHGAAPTQGPDTRGAAPQGFFIDQPRTNPDGSVSTRIYINADGASARTPYHEAAHVFSALAKAFTPAEFFRLRDQIVRTYGQEKIDSVRKIYSAALYGIDPATGNPRAEVAPLEFLETELVTEALANTLQGRQLVGKSDGITRSALQMLGRAAETAGLYKPQTAGGVTSGKTGVFGQSPSFEVQTAAASLFDTVFGAIPQPEPSAPAPEAAAPDLGSAPIGTPPPPQPAQAPAPTAAPTPSATSGVETGAISPAAPVAPVSTPAERVVSGEPRAEEPAPKTADNLRLSLDQRNAVSQPLDLYGAWQEVDVLVQTTPGIDPEVKATWDRIFAERSKYSDQGMPPFEILYRAVKPKEGRPTPARRRGRRNDQAEAYIAEASGALPEDIRALFQKTSSFYNTVLRKNPDGSLNLNFWAFSPDKVFGNALIATKLLTDAGAMDLMPYTVSYDGLTVDEINQGKVWSNQMLQDLAADVATYVGNQSKGYTGAGKRFDREAARNAGFADYLPPERGNPTPLSDQKADFINFLMALPPPETSVTRGAQARRIPANIMARILAESQGRAVVPSSMAAEGEFTSGKKRGSPRNLFRAQDYPGLLRQDIEIGEANPFRERMIDRGVDPDTIRDSLTESIEEISIENIESVRTAPESQIQGAPSISAVRAGFMPADLGPVTQSTAQNHPAPQTIEPRPIGTDTAEIDLPVVGADPAGLFVGEDIGLVPARFMPSAPGDTVTPPSASYPEADKKAGSGNLWVRQTDAPTNADRVLVVQFTPDLMYPDGPDPVSTPYYDALYSGLRQGYDRSKDFWEIPQWQAVVTHALGERVDSYYVRNVEEAKRFLEASDYGHVAFSVMDVSAKLTQDVAPSIGGKLHLGGYTDRKAIAEAHPNAVIYDDMKSFVESFGVPYKKGFDYRLFRDTKTIPRLELSAGCRHRCTFCTIDRKVTESPAGEINQQVDAFSELDGTLVYLNDKTFGQAENHKELPSIYRRMKAANPNFAGFVIQTTAAQMRLFSEDYLRDAGIRYIELGVETYNDTILKTLRKPANEKLIDEAVEKMRRLGIGFIPNIVIGFPGETAATYGRTKAWLEKNSDTISHVNTYNLAVYEGTELSREVETKTAADADENSPNKSFYKDPAIHRDFAAWIYDYGTKQLEKAQADAVRVAREQGRAMPAEDVETAFTLTAEQLPSFYEPRGGLTKTAVELGEAVGPEGAERLSARRVEAERESKARMAAFRANPEIDPDMTATMAAAMNHQFWREALEAATNTGSVATARETGLLGRAMPAQTEAGKKLEADGYEFTEEARLDAKLVQARKGGRLVGELRYWQDPGMKPPSAGVGDVWVDTRHQKRGIGEALYRELATKLQADGIQKLHGTVVDSEDRPRRIRERVFGKKPEVRGAWDVVSTIDADRKFLPAPPENTPAFKKFFDGAHPSVKDGDAAKVFYHGTLSDFEAFDESKLSPEAYMGPGVYLTSSPKDASVNYASPTGDDQRNKLETTVDQLDAPNAPDAKAQAAERLGWSHRGAVLPVVTALTNPVELGSVHKGSGWSEKPNPKKFGPTTTWEYQIDEDGNETGSGVEVLMTLQSLLSGKEYGEFLDALGYDWETDGGLNAVEVRGALNRIYTEYEGGAGAVFGEMARRLGHDGIVDHAVPERFTMKGIGTATHVVVFDPAQVKSVFNRGTFNTADTRLLAMPAQTELGQALEQSEGLEFRLSDPIQYSDESDTLFVVDVTKPMDEAMQAELKKDARRWLDTTGRNVRNLGDPVSIGYIRYNVDTDWSNASIDMSFVDDMFRGKKIGEALYREMATHLQAEGVRRVLGMVVDSQGRPQKIREKVFGKNMTTVGAPSAAFAGSVPVETYINPLRKFMPANIADPTEQIFTAAIRLPSASEFGGVDGEVFIAPMHALAFDDAVEKYGQGVRDNLEAGFVTTAGRFVSRKEADRVARKAGQIDPKEYDAAAKESLMPPRAKFGLESLTFDETRKFLPPLDPDSDAFAKWAGKDLIRNPDGSPREWYHFTFRPIADFVDPAKASPRAATYFTDDLRLAEVWNGNPKTVYLKVKKTATREDFRGDWGEKVGVSFLQKEEVDALKEKGYDSVTGTFAGFPEVPEIAVFDKNQIRLAPYSVQDRVTEEVERIRKSGKPMPAALEDFTTGDEALRAGLSKEGWAVVTATQEALGDHQHPLNLEANAALAAELAATNHDVIEVRGKYKGVDQGINYLVIGIAEDQALDMAKRYNQESVLTNNGLIYADGSVVPTVPNSVKVGKDALAEEFHTELPDGTVFAVSLNWEDRRIRETGRAMASRAANIERQPALWILPNSVVEAAQGMHEDYLALNADALNKKFGTKFSKTADVDERNKALQAGFVRVRYRPQSGELVIEMGPGTLRRQRAVIERLLLDNAERADRLTVSVLDTKGGKVKTVNTANARLFDAEDPVAAAIAALDEISESGRAMPAKAITLPGDIDKAIARAAKEAKDERINVYSVTVTSRPDSKSWDLFGESDAKPEVTKELVSARSAAEARRIAVERVENRLKEKGAVIVRSSAPEMKSSFDIPYLSGATIKGVDSIKGRKFNDTDPAKLAERYDKLFSAVDKAKAFADKMPNLGYSQDEWKAAMAVALSGSAGSIPPAPLRLMNWLRDPDELKRFIDTADPALVDAAKKGLDSLKPVHEASRNREIPVEMVALHFAWGILSRMLDPVSQEAGWIRLTADPEFNRQLARSIDGTFDLSKDDWKAIVKRAMTDEAGIATGRGATANANNIYALLKNWNGRWRELASVINDPSLTGPDMRREYFRRGFGEGAGIQHKVLSFVLATLARADMFVLDRWQTVSMWFPQVQEAARRRAAEGGSPDAIIYSKEGVPEDSTGSYNVMTGDAGLATTTVSEAVYAMIERGLQKVVDANREYLTRLLGREPTVFDLHWISWNIIKEEGVGHSSLESTLEAMRQGDIYGTQEFPERFADIPKQTEGRGARGTWITFKGRRGAPAEVDIRPLGGAKPAEAAAIGAQAILPL